MTKKDIQPLFEQRFRKEIRNGEIEFAFAYSGEQALGCRKIISMRQC